jgi:hypothetical protein
MSFHEKCPECLKESGPRETEKQAKKWLDNHKRIVHKAGHKPGGAPRNKTCIEVPGKGFQKKCSCCDYTTPFYPKASTAHSNLYYHMTTKHGQGQKAANALVSLDKPTAVEVKASVPASVPYCPMCGLHLEKVAASVKKVMPDPIAFCPRCGTNVQVFAMAAMISQKYTHKHKL